MEPIANVKIKDNAFEVTVGSGYYEIYIDKKPVYGYLRDGQSKEYTVADGPHEIGVYSRGRFIAQARHVFGEEETTSEDASAEPEQKDILAMDFAQAITAVKAGKRIQRAGWNGKAQYIELATCISYKNAAGEIVNAEHMAIGNQALAFVGTSGVQIGWLASQADMLANDWTIVESMQEDTP